jgi:hypothetical protein
MDILPSAQRLVWPELRAAAALGFVLYGGTAIALRLGHRFSVDFDFFSEEPLERENLRSVFPFMERATTLQDRGNTLTLLVPAADDQPVKISFFGGIDFGRVGEPDWTPDGVLQVAALEDLLATKLKVILQRAEAKDYRDLAAMRRLFGSAFQPGESLKALVYFDDGDVPTLAVEDRRILIESVRLVRDLPEVVLRSPHLLRGQE